MTLAHWTAKGLLHHSPRRLVWRSLIAAPFALSLVLALILGPAPVDNPHSSFGSLVAWSLVAALGFFIVSDGLLIAAGFLALVVFPLHVGLGFHFAPSWAEPIVVVAFYGSIAASLAAVGNGLTALVPPLVRTHPRAVAIAAGGVALLSVGAIVALTSAPAAVAGQAAASDPTLLNLGPVINTAQREAEPTFSTDGKTMIFNCHDYDICVSHLTGSWKEGQWSEAQLLGPPISSDYLEIEPWLSPDGTKLYINSNRPFADGAALTGVAVYVNLFALLGQVVDAAPFGGVGLDEIWVSYLRDGTWSELVNLNDAPDEPPVNSKHMDHCLAFSADGNEAFWTSTRPGGFGGNDIWTSRRVAGKWTAPENLGPNINSAASEHHSLPTPDGRHLQVTSDRPSGLGGDDMYVARRQTNRNWGPLVNIGDRINGPANDRCAAWTPDGSVFLFDSDRTGGFGSKDLWWLDIKDVVPAMAGGG
jgi:WD40-like Beta Propeller Repeat